jgi:hypothetical protein
LIPRKKATTPPATGKRCSFLNGTNTTILCGEGGWPVQDAGHRRQAEFNRLEMLDRIKAGDLKGAKVLLDWLREDQHLAGGDDPLGGPIFPRFWTKGQAADARKMKLAAAAILVGTKPTVAQGVAILEEALKDASTSTAKKPTSSWRWRLDTRLQDNFAKLLDVSSALLKQFRNPRRPSWYNVRRSWGWDRYDEAIALCRRAAEAAGRRRPRCTADERCLSSQSRGNFAAARGWAQKLMAIRARKTPAC